MIGIACTAERVGAGGRWRGSDRSVDWQRRMIIFVLGRYCTEDIDAFIGDLSAC